MANASDADRDRDRDRDMGLGLADLVPRPDPTRLTSASIFREIAALKEVIFTRLDAMDKAIALFNDNITRVPTDTDKQIQHLKELHDGRFDGYHEEFNQRCDSISQSISLVNLSIETRLEGMDKAIKLLQDISDKFQYRVDEKISALAGVHNEKFHSIEVQFSERDVRTEQTSRDSKVAVDAALQAAKEAVAEQNRSSALAIAKSETATIKQIDQQGLLIQTSNGALDGKITDIKERLTRIEGKGEGLSIGWLILIGGVGLIGTLLGIAAFFKNTGGIP